MSGGGDEFLSRWSRRKLAARQPGLAEKEEANAAPAGPAATDEVPVEAERLDAEPVETEPAEAEPPEPLPRLDDLKAGSDLSAFLRKGVPTALKNSALRKMWSLDPAIRDYVGPAEYAWDFNTPGSMPGFGPLEAGSPIVDFLSTTARSVLTGRQEEAEAMQPAGEAQPAGLEDGGLPESEAGAAVGGTAAEEPATAEPDGLQHESGHAEATPAETRAVAESLGEPARPRHGGALPR